MMEEAGYSLNNYSLKDISTQIAKIDPKIATNFLDARQETEDREIEKVIQKNWMK